jgi:hypothetical protein
MSAMHGNFLELTNETVLRILMFTMVLLLI